MDDIGATVGRQTPLLALFIPLVLVFMVDGRRGVRQTWLMATVAGVTFAIAQFLCSNYFIVELTDIVASLVAAAAIVLLLRVWSPVETIAVETLDDDEMQSRISSASAAAHKVEGVGPARGHDGSSTATTARPSTATDSRADVFRAYVPYAMIIVVFALSQIPVLKELLGRVRAFVHEDVLPAEIEIEDPHDVLKSWHVVERLRDRARERGIYTPHLPEEWGGLGVGVLGMALISQECGVSGLASLGLSAPMCRSLRMGITVATSEPALLGSGTRHLSRIFSRAASGGLRAGS